MSLPRIRLERCKVLGEGLWLIDREQEHHLTKVLRTYEGAMIEGLLPKVEGDEKLLLRLERTTDGLALREVERTREEPETVRIHLLIGLLKADQFDAVLRGVAELGLFSVRPVACARSVPRFSDAEMPKKLQRWQKILDEGSKVSGSVRPPTIHPPIAFADIEWMSLPKARYAALLTPRTSLLSSVSNVPAELVFAVGPEGDWLPEEARHLLENGFGPVSLGRRVLRASTAAIVGCGWFRLMAG